MSPETEEPDAPKEPQRREPPPEAADEKLLRSRSKRDCEWWNEDRGEIGRRLSKFLWIASVVISIPIAVAAVWVGVSIKPPPEYVTGHDRLHYIKFFLVGGGVLLPIAALIDGSEHRSRTKRLAARIIGYSRRLRQLRAETERWYPGYDLELMYGYANVWYVPSDQLEKEDRETLEAIKPGEQKGKYHKLSLKFGEATHLREGELFVRDGIYVMRVKSIGLAAVYVEVVQSFTTFEKWQQHWKSLSKQQRANLGA